MKKTHSAKDSTSLVEREARLKEGLFKELAELGTAWLSGRGEPHLVFDVGCGRGLSVLHGWHGVLNRAGVVAELVLLDRSLDALKEASKLLAAVKRERPVHFIAAEASRLPLRRPREAGWLGFYGSVLHELRGQGRLDEALDEASQHFEALVGYDFVDPDPERSVELSEALRHPAVRERAEALTELGAADSLTVVLEAVYQLSHPRDPSLSHLHFNARFDEVLGELMKHGYEVEWSSLKEVDEEAELRLEVLGLDLKLPRGLKARAAWLAVSQRRVKSFLSERPT